jgi:hypothetical protein
MQLSGVHVEPSFPGGGGGYSTAEPSPKIGGGAASETIGFVESERSDWKSQPAPASKKGMTKVSERTWTWRLEITMILTSTPWASGCRSHM